MRRLPFLWLAAWLAFALQAASKPDHVVLISIDGLAPDYYVHPDQYHLRIPNLRQCSQEGTASSGVEGVFPTITYPNHTAVVTGTLPVEHGIVGNNPFDPFNKTDEGWYWYSEDLRVPALWDVVRRAGKTVGTVYWPVTVGANVDYNFPEFRVIRSEDDVKLLRVLATPGLVSSIEKQYGKIPGERITDRIRSLAAAYIIEHHRPNLLLVHLTDLDGVQHRSGPGSPEAVAMLEQIDAHLGAIRAAARKAGIWEKTAWIIVSDHGFRKVTHEFHPRVLLCSLGYLHYGTDGKLAEWRVEAQIDGGTFGLVAKNPDDRQAIEELTRQVKMLATDPRNGIAQIYSREELKKLGAFPEAFLVVESAANFKMGEAHTGAMVTASNSKGAHGYHPARPDQLASLILCGPGIAAGRKLDGGRLIDVASTVADLLGLSMPTARGSVLHQALQ